MDAFHFLDGLVKKLEELEKTAELYKGTVLSINRELIELSDSLQITSTLYRFIPKLCCLL